MNTPQAVMHECSVPECGAMIRTALLMCPRHRRMVPKHIRNEVLDAWSAVQSGDAPIEHLHSAQAHATVTTLAPVKGGAA